MVAGSLQEKNNKFYIVLNYKDSKGKSVSKWIATGLAVKGNKKLAEEMLIEARQNFVIEEEPIKNILFSDYIVKWLESIKRTIQITTYSAYYRTINDKIKPYFQEKGILLSNLTEKDIHEYYNYCFEQGLKTVTVLKHHANIRKAVAQAVEDEILNPIILTKLKRPIKPKEENFKANFLNIKELNMLFKSQG